MSRYIDADILKTKKKHSKEFCENIVSVADIDWMPTVDAVPVAHGHWIKERVDHTEFEMLDHVARCSNCGCVPDDHYTFAYVNMMWKYCPECGSKMDEVTE